MMKLAYALLLGATLLNAAPALAHGGPMQPFFGGQMAEAGAWHVEFAIRDGKVRVWVRDHMDMPVQASGKATLLVNGQKLDLPLAPNGDKLTAEAPIKSGDKITAVLALSVNGTALSARFTQEAVVTPTLSPQAQTGKQAFEQICAACHGPSLRGTDAGPPLLHPYYAPGAGHGDDVVLTAMAEGRKSHHWKFGDMPKPQGLKAGQEPDLLAYLRAMQAANGIVAPAAAGDMGGHNMHDMHGGH